MSAKYSPSQILQAAELRERGLTFRNIAKKTGMTFSSAVWHCRRQGATHPTKTFKRPINKPAVRNGHPVRPFTPEEDAQLLDLSLQGLNNSQISAALARPNASIRNRLVTLALREIQA